MVLGKMVPGKMVPEKNGPQKNGPRKIGPSGWIFGDIFQFFTFLRSTVTLFEDIFSLKSR